MICLRWYQTVAAEWSWMMNWAAECQYVRCIFAMPMLVRYSERDRMSGVESRYIEYEGIGWGLLSMRPIRILLSVRKSSFSRLACRGAMLNSICLFSLIRRQCWVTFSFDFYLQKISWCIFQIFLVQLIERNLVHLLNSSTNVLKSIL